MFATWQDFTRKKMQALLAYAQEGEDHPESRQTAVLKELTPVTLWNGFASALTAMVSFIFPIIHALAK
jgi:hypothetical protein